MYDPNQKQYILKNSFGVSYHVYFEPGRGLCLRMLGESLVWSRSYILSDLAVNDFSVVLDGEDIFHFVFQSKDGRILYGHGRSGQIEIQPILNSKDTTPWPKHVSMQLREDIVLFFYLVRYRKRNLLSMQTLKAGTLGKPSVIDYIDGPDIRYLSFLDRAGKCHLIYTNSDNTNARLLHRIIKDDHTLFHAPVKLHVSGQDILFPSVVCSAGDQIHLLFHDSGENSCQVLYKNLSQDKPAVILYQGRSPAGYTGLVHSGGNLFFFRAAAENIYYRSLSEPSAAWSEETSYCFADIDSVVCFSYVSNAKKEKGFNAYELPGNFSRGYQLAFFREDPPSQSPPTIVPEPSRPITNRGMLEAPSHKTQIIPQTHPNEPAAKDPALKDVERKILLLQNLTGNMQKELTKLWLTQKEYEKKLEQLLRSQRQDYSQFTNREEPQYTQEDGTNGEPCEDIEKKEPEKENKPVTDMDTGSELQSIYEE